MPETRQNQSNANSISSNGPIDKIQEGMMKVDIEEGDHDHESTQYPDRPGEPDCIYYLRTGKCGYASNCRFNHPPHPIKSEQNKSELPQREGQPDCGYYLKTGTCKYGSTCKYHHPLDRRGAGQVTLNSLGLPLREQEKPCPFYLRTKKCKYGPACKFDHPQLASDETAAPIPGAVTSGMGSALPSSGFPYVGALPAWSWTRSPYVASSRTSGPQPYMPYFIPPIQGGVASQNWNGYLGNMSAVSNVMGTDLVYSSKNPGEIVNGGHVDLLTMAISNLPERPDQPECRYFISTGNCKYGLSCRFNHPKGRTVHSLGPHGLPLRPGVDICTHFSSYGICKYGPTCKFNHPLTGYISSYYFGMPPIPVLNQPFIPNPRNLSVSNPSETSHSKSLKITDWIQKPENVGGKSRPQSVTKTVEDSTDQVGDQSDAAIAPTTEVPKDQSD